MNMSFKILTVLAVLACSTDTMATDGVTHCYGVFTDGHEMLLAQKRDQRQIFVVDEVDSGGSSPAERFPATQKKLHDHFGKFATILVTGVPIGSPDGEKRNLNFLLSPTTPKEIREKNGIGGIRDGVEETIPCLQREIFEEIGEHVDADTLPEPVVYEAGDDGKAAYFFIERSKECLNEIVRRVNDRFDKMNALLDKVDGAIPLFSILRRYVEGTKDLKDKVYMKNSKCRGCIISVLPFEDFLNLRHPINGSTIRSLLGESTCYMPMPEDELSGVTLHPLEVEEEVAGDSDGWSKAGKKGKKSVEPKLAGWLKEALEKYKSAVGGGTAAASSSAAPMAAAVTAYAAASSAAAADVDE